MKYTYLLLCLFLPKLVMANNISIPIIGLDQNGETQMAELDGQNYSKLLDHEIKESKLLADSKIAEELARGDMISHRLLLRGLMVGLGVSGEIGLGPFKLGAGINHQFYFDVAHN